MKNILMSGSHKRILMIGVFAIFCMLVTFSAGCVRSATKTDSGSEKPQVQTGSEKPQVQNRIEQLPKGDQTKFLKAFFAMSPVEPEAYERKFSAPFKNVFSVMKIVAKKFEKEGKRKVVTVDAESGKIQNGTITQDKTVGLRSGSMLDEITMEATSIDKVSTNVSVTRRVVVYKYESGNRYWATEYSNGNIESWILTQIEDGLLKPGK